MKKIVLSLIAVLLLCTMCMGFVACHDDPPTPEPSGINLYDFAKETKFSFGKFEEGKIIGHGNRYLYGESYASAIAPDYVNEKALLMANDIAYQSTVSAMQSIFDKYSDVVDYYPMTNDMIAITGSKEQSLSDYIERGKGAFLCSNSSDTLDKCAAVEQMSVGDKRRDKSLLVKKEENEVWLSAYFFNSILRTYTDIPENALAHIRVEYIIEMYNKVNGAKVSMTAVIELIYSSSTIDCSNDALLGYVIGHSTITANVLDTATADEKLTMGKDYFEVMEEVVNAWIEDERGQAYLNEYNQ